MEPACALVPWAVLATRSIMPLGRPSLAIASMAATVQLEVTVSNVTTLTICNRRSYRQELHKTTLIEVAAVVLSAQVESATQALGVA